MHFRHLRLKGPVRGYPVKHSSRQSFGDSPSHRTSSATYWVMTGVEPRRSYTNNPRAVVD